MFRIRSEVFFLMPSRSYLKVSKLQSRKEVIVMDKTSENVSYDVTQFDRILARTLATELTGEALAASEENQTTLISTGAEGTEDQ
jgi:hypothetical protein